MGHLFERRPLIGLLFGLTVCVSIWRISLQEPSITASDMGYTSQGVHQQQQQQQYQQQPHIQQKPFFSADWPNIDSINIKSDRVNNNAYYNNGHGRSIHNANSDTTNFKSKHRNVNNRKSRSENMSNSTSYVTGSIIDYKDLPKNDFNRLIDLNDFDFLMNQPACRRQSTTPSNNVNELAYNTIDNDGYNGNKGNPLLLILVHSAPGNYRKRLLIRETWGSVNTSKARLIFLLGAVAETKQQRRLEQENRMYSDMVQGNFVDAYRNMTYKHVMALKWFTYYCPTAQYILKMDDDIFVNSPYLIKFLEDSASSRGLLFCQLQCWSRVKRSYRSKWRVSHKDYAGRYYPPYCPGYSIVYSPDVAFRLYKEAQKSRYFWIDDVHITGTMAQKANITITSFADYLLKDGELRNTLAGKTDFNSFRFIFVQPDISEEENRYLWKQIESLR